MADRLRGLYEAPTTTVRSGPERARKQLRMLAAVLPAPSGRPPVVVDVGCGDGTWTAAARGVAGASGTAPTVVGLDWSERAALEARRRGVAVARAAVDPPGLPLRPRSVDVVVMSEFIEHLVDTDQALAEAARVLVPGGHLLLSTPNLAAWFNRALLAVGVQPVFSEVSLQAIYGRPGREVVGHLHLFTKRALTQMLEAHGFVDVTVEGGRYHDVPRGLRTVDRMLTAIPSLSSILLAKARTPS